MNTPIEQLDLSDNPTTDSIAQLIGTQLLEELSQHLGGFQLTIPMTVGENSPIAVAIGLEAAKRVCSVYGGFKFDVPVKPGREKRIKDLHDKGYSKSAITRELKLTRGQVYRTVDKIVNKSQLDFFQAK